MKLTKYICHALTIKYMRQMIQFIRQLIFIKIVLQGVKGLKKIVIKQNRLKKIVINKIVIIEKDYDN